MTETLFATTADLIFVHGTIAGPLGERALRLAFDTASAGTVISRAVIDALGYSLGSHLRRVNIVGATGKHAVPVLPVARFQALGFEEGDFDVEVADLPYDDLDGILGLSFLRKLNYEVRSAEGRILAEPAW